MVGCPGCTETAIVPKTGPDLDRRSPAVWYVPSGDALGVFAHRDKVGG
jgi:hypothetical protein